MQCSANLVAGFIVPVSLSYVSCNKLHVLATDFSPAAARKFYDEGVKTLEGLFFVMTLYDMHYSQIGSILQLYIFSLLLDLKKIEHKLNHHQQIGLR